MALTLTKQSRSRAGHRQEVVFDFVFDSSYATGGESLTPEDLGLKQIETLDVVESPDGYSFTYDRASKKLLAFRYDYPNASAGPAIEVPNGTNLSAVNGRLVARGF
jgi:hypothetical protein